MNHWTSDLSNIIVMKNCCSYLERYKSQAKEFEEYCKITGVLYTTADSILRPIIEEKKLIAKIHDVMIPNDS